MKEIVKLEQSQKELAAEVITNAFFDYPMFTPFFPNLKRRKRQMMWLFEKTLNCTMRYGEAVATSDFSGMMCILFPGHEKLTQDEFIKNGFLLMPFVMGYKSYSKFDKYEKFAAEIQEKLLRDRRYYYLWILATDPKKQGLGIGSALMKFLIQKADAERMPIYLRTETSDNALFYEKFGFKIMHKSATPVPGLDIWCMLRETLG